MAVWTEDEAGPYTTEPYGGSSWQPAAEPLRQPHEYLRNGTAKLLTLFHPSSGQVRAKGVTNTTNPVLHGWLKEELMAILSAMPQPALTKPSLSNLPAWRIWQAGLKIKITLPELLPPLRMLLIMDNLAGHKSVEFVLWMFKHGIMPLYTPLSGSWLNMAESIQRILKRRALEGYHPQTSDQIIDWLEAVVRGWNQNPTPFI